MLTAEQLLDYTLLIDHAR